MSKLDELLQGVDVEWKALGQVCVFRNGFAFKSKLFKDSGLPIVRITNINEDRVDLTNVKFFDINDYKNTNLSNYIVESSDILIAMSGATTGKIGIYESQTISYLNQRVGKFKPNENVLLKKYLYYNLLFKSNFIYELAGGGAQPNLSSNLLMDKFLIPIPCPDHPEKSLEIQQEIVRVLDELTSLTNQLKTELETERQNRKKQFEFFREQLFRFEEGSIIFNKLGEIGEFQRGKRFVKTDMISEGVPCIHYGEMYTHYGIWANKTKSFLSKELVDSKKLRLAKKNDVIMVAAGETIEDIGKGTSWLSDQGVVFHDACFSYTSPLNPSYVAYFTRTKQFHDQIRRNISSGKISAINSKGLEKVYIPIPSLEEQERIVKLLDQLDATHTAIEEEITKEIKLRTQQYEYYREKLLTFPKN